MRRRRLAILLLIGLLLVGYMVFEAMRMPAMRVADLPLTGLPAGHAPVKIALLADTHLSGPDNSPARMGRIVDAINAAKPDLILLGGDYIGDRKLIGRVYSVEQAVAPFARLKAPLGIVAVLGNHDHWEGADAVTAELRRIGVTVLRNAAGRRGPLAIGGIDDAHTGNADPRRTLAAVHRLGGAPLLFTHSPDVFPDLLPGAPLLLAGHNHCGQGVLPFYGPVTIPSRYGKRYMCGLYREYGKTLVVTGGVGTSVLPFRLLARSDWWLITLIPPARKGGRG